MNSKGEAAANLDEGRKSCDLRNAVFDAYQGDRCENESGRCRGSLADWIDRIAEKGLGGLPLHLERNPHETMAERYARLAEKGLLRYPVAFSLFADFVSNPGKCLTCVEGEELFLFVEQTDPRLPFARRCSRTLRSRAAECAHFLGRLLGPEESLQVSVLPYFHLTHNATIIVRPDGTIIGEFAAGDASPTKSGAVISCSFNRDALTGKFLFSTESPELRAVMLRALAAVPHDGYGRECRYAEGYYEIGVSEKEEVFFDYRNEAFFCC